MEPPGQLGVVGTPLTRQGPQWVVAEPREVWGCTGWAVHGTAPWRVTPSLPGSRNSGPQPAYTAEGSRCGYPVTKIWAPHAAYPAEPTRRTGPARLGYPVGGFLHTGSLLGDWCRGPEGRRGKKAREVGSLAPLESPGGVYHRVGTR